MVTLRNLKIKTGTCKRLVKEFHSYEKEVEREAAKTALMKDKGADPYDLKQQGVSYNLGGLEGKKLKDLEAYGGLESENLRERVSSDYLYRRPPHILLGLRNLDTATMYQENVLAESRMMIPDCRKRLEASLADLKGTLAELEEELNQKEGPEIEEARTIIAEVDKLFQTTEA
ncbi:hypothetical protein ACLB2K_073720 [Fragaria x ananassa]